MLILGRSISHCNMVVKATSVPVTLRLRPLVESTMNRVVRYAPGNGDCIYQAAVAVELGRPSRRPYANLSTKPSSSRLTEGADQRLRMSRAS
jgi:hypothetical protein